MAGHIPQPAPRAPLAAGEPVTKNWARINEEDADIGVLFAQVAQIRRDLDANPPPRYSFGQFPFRIYQLPQHFRAAPDPSSDWLKFRVRGGAVFINWTQYAATGTDGETNPDADTFPDIPNAGGFEITATPGVTQFWFWLAITSTTAAVNSGASPPTWSAAAVPIGYVDTTDTTHQFAQVRQFVRTDFFTCV